MAHFLPVYFYGNKQDHVTAHSYERFKNLNLRVGDKVLLTYNNEVMTYLTKAPQEMQDPNNPNRPLEFPDNCPSCGQPLYISDSGASAFCANFWCPERALARLSNTLKKLGVKGFAERTVYTLGVTHLSELYNYDVDEMERRIGKVNAANFISELRRIQNAGLPDYKLIGAIGFTSIAEKTWKIILEQFPIERVLEEPDSTFRYLEAIDGIGFTTVDTIVKERPLFLEELKFIFSTFNYTKSNAYGGRPKQQVAMTGFRDKELCKLLNDTGIYDADANNGLTKKTALLIVPYANYTEGSKIGKAFNLLSQSYAKATGMDQLPINWSNLHMVNGINGVLPRIITKEEAYKLVESLQK
jgi:DNA ligase (NAD+)